MEQLGRVDIPQPIKDIEDARLRQELICWRYVLDQLAKTKDE